MNLNQPSGPQVGGIVVCGGESRRMGAPKAWLRIRNDYLLHLVIRAVCDAVDSVVVAARRGQPLPPLPVGIGRVDDEFDDSGPLAGLLSGMEHFASSCDAVFVTACDHPLLTSAFVKRLIVLLEEHPAVAVRSGGHLFPLTAVYRIETRELLRQHLVRRERRAHAFAEDCRARFVGPDAFADIDPQLASLKNVNDPSSFERLADGAITDRSNEPRTESNR